MGKVYEEITPGLRNWMSAQHVFFIATAPLSGGGHVNCSPKGLDTLRWAELRAHFPSHVGERAIIRVEVGRISDSCGYGVPRYAYVEERDTLPRWARAKGPQGLPVYRREKNSRSIDGLPGFEDDGGA